MKNQTKNKTVILSHVGHGATTTKPNGSDSTIFTAPETFNNKPESETIEFGTTKFKLTDKVKITDSQFAYFYYSRMFEKMGFKNKLQNVVEDISGIWEVFAISQNVNQPKEILLGLTQGDKELLISTYHVKLLEPMKMDTMPFKYKEMRTADTAPVKHLKKSTQQKRVEQIANLTADLKAATLTIENQALEINDLNFRNDNLRSQVVTANERIEILQHENKNYESAIAVLEGQNTAANSSLNLQDDEIFELEESRELIAKTNTKLYITVFIFGLIITIESLIIWAN